MDDAFAVPPAPLPTLAVAGSDARFPVRRIYCIGRNYADHAKEMGATPSREAPLFFLKPADAIVADGSDIPYPPATQDLHHEVEMVVALGSGGRDIPVERALHAVFGYAVGLDLTRRDLQAAAKAKGWPWDAGKAFDASAPVSALHPVAAIGHPRSEELVLEVNGNVRQRANIADMLFPVAAIVHELSKLWTLQPGDLVFTGTPAGVAPLQRGDAIEARLGAIAKWCGKVV